MPNSNSRTIQIVKHSTFKKKRISKKGKVLDSSFNYHNLLNYNKVFSYKKKYIKNVIQTT